MLASPLYCKHPFGNPASRTSNSSDVPRLRLVQENIFYCRVQTICSLCISHEALEGFGAAGAHTDRQGDRSQHYDGLQPEAFRKLAPFLTLLPATESSQWHAGLEPQNPDCHSEESSQSPEHVWIFTWLGETHTSAVLHNLSEATLGTFWCSRARSAINRTSLISSPPTRVQWTPGSLYLSVTMHPLRPVAIQKTSGFLHPRWPIGMHKTPWSCSLGQISHDLPVHFC
jgi:hypothetical protein